MEALTNTDYYNILLEGCKQAFESKENYCFEKELNRLKGSLTPKIYSNLLQKIVTVPQQNYLKEKDVFFKYLEKAQLDFEEKYSVKKSDFYSKCLIALSVKLEVEKKESTGVGITRTYHYVNLPNDLKFLVSMKIHIKYKSLQFNDTPKPQQNEIAKTEMPQELYIPKPCFEPESIESIIQDLNTFFDISQHSELKRIIETGSNTNEKLLFRDNGNRLTDYFKELFESDIIIGCTKKDLINWIVENFKYTYRSTQKEFIYKTVEKIISNKDRLCKNPII